jgi:hypothetical protein
MTDSFRSSIASQVAAAKARDAQGIIVAARAYVASRNHFAAGAIERGAGYPSRFLGSVILLGEGHATADRIWRIAFRQTEDRRDISLRSIPETEWHVTELELLRQLRLLDGDWRPLPNFGTRRDLPFLYPNQRRLLRASNDLFIAMAARDGKAATKAIAAIGRADGSEFSVLAYALFREAQRSGVAVKIPRAYAF